MTADYAPYGYDEWGVPLPPPPIPSAIQTTAPVAQQSYQDYQQALAVAFEPFVQPVSYLPPPLPEIQSPVYQTGGNLGGSSAANVLAQYGEDTNTYGGVQQAFDPVAANTELAAMYGYGDPAYTPNEAQRQMVAQRIAEDVQRRTGIGGESTFDRAVKTGAGLAGDVLGADVIPGFVGQALVRGVTGDYLGTGDVLGLEDYLRQRETNGRVSLADLYQTADRPSDIAKQQAINVIGDNPYGRTLGEALNIALAPETIVGAGIAGPSALANIAGRGSMRTAPYLTSMIGSQVAMSAAKEAGAPDWAQLVAAAPGALLGAGAPALARAGVTGARALPGAAETYARTALQSGAAGIPEGAALRAISPETVRTGGLLRNPTEGIASLVKGAADEPLGSIIARVEAKDPKVTAAYLRSVAEQRGIDLGEAKTKAQIVEALKAADVTPAPATTQGGGRFYHETTASNALGILETGTIPKGNTGQLGMYLSDVPELALGQGGKGGVVEFDASLVKARPVSKPGQSPEMEAAGRELVSESAEPKSALKVTLYQPLDRATQLRLRVGQRAGELNVVTNADGSVTVTRGPNAWIEKVPATGAAARPIAVMPENIRASYPNAYAAWTDADRATLQQMKAAGAATEEIALALGRQPSAIHFEWSKLSGEPLAKEALGDAGETMAEIAARREMPLGEFVQEAKAAMGNAKPPKDGGFDFWDEVVSLLGLPRALKATLDISAPFRQGLALAFVHPVEWAQAWVPMFKAWGSEEGMQAVLGDIDRIMGKWGELGKGIHFYDVGPEAKGLSRVPGFEPQGKGYVARAVRKVPGIAKSERAYATFLNYQKARTFDNMAKAYMKAGETDPAHYRNLGSIIDHATGFGAAPAKGGLAGEAFFSQRYFTSRFQFLADPIVEGLAKGDLRTAREATKNLIGFVGGVTSLLMLAKESGAADVELDPRSTDFGKIRVGSQRIDISAGFIPIVRTAARIASGESKAATGSIYGIKPEDEALKFLRNKLAPIPSMAVDRLVGENVIGEKPPKLLSLKMVKEMFMPLIVESMVDTWKETGDPLAVLRGAVAEGVGMGTSTYGSGQVEQIARAQEQFGKQYDSLHSSQQAAINAEIAASGIDLPYRNRQAPWMQARDDAFEDFKRNTSPEIVNAPLTQKALTITDYDKIKDTLIEWEQETYGLSYIDAEDAVSNFLRVTKLDELVQQYREDVLRADPEFMDVWLKAYPDETEFRPPKWARDFVNELRGVTP